MPVRLGLMTSVRIDIWSDFVCPFCLLEEPVLDEAARTFGDRIEIVWRAYELRPDPVPTLEPDGEYLRTTWARAVYPMAAQRGMTLRLPPVQPRSRLAHEAEHHARRVGRGDEMRRALFRAFFEDGRDIGDIGVLVDVGTAVGLAPDDLRRALQRGDETDAVLADQRQATELGIRGVPAMVLTTPAHAGDAVLVSGAQPFVALRHAIEQMPGFETGAPRASGPTPDVRAPR